MHVSRSKWLMPLATIVLTTGIVAALQTRRVDQSALKNAEKGTEWLTYGHSYSEQRYSTLKQIDTTNVSRAARVMKGKVIIGNAGAEFAPYRGYVAAFDVNNGKELWRFYTVPGDPSKPFENKEMEAAAKTWSGEWWKYGGGGSMWDGM